MDQIYPRHGMSSSKLMAGLCTLIGVALIVAALFTVSQYNSAGTKASCQENNDDDPKVGGTCHVWDGTQCRKGTLSQDKDNKSEFICTASSHSMPLILGIAGIVLILGGVFGYFTAHTIEHDKYMEHKRAYYQKLSA